ncbi:MAG: hypothetical protein Kow0099_07310 [Candidatus Abyssubacteria bacterium]
MRYACRIELKTIIDFNPDVARRALGTLPTIDFRRGETALIRDISERGLSLESDHLLPEGMLMKIAVENPVAPPIEAVARVVWSKKLTENDTKYAMGMEFRNMKDKHRKNLNTLVAFLKNIPE